MIHFHFGRKVTINEMFWVFLDGLSWRLKLYTGCTCKLPVSPSDWPMTTELIDSGSAAEAERTTRMINGRCL